MTTTASLMPGGFDGLVGGEAILGANIFKDFFAGIRDIVGGRSAAYEGELRQAKEIALAEMSQQAQELGANAVIAVDLDYETINTAHGVIKSRWERDGDAIAYCFTIPANTTATIRLPLRRRPSS
jgi:uncharacterized protein YbjQ (UPF0145 family)